MTDSSTPTSETSDSRREAKRAAADKEQRGLRHVRLHHRQRADEHVLSLPRHQPGHADDDGTVGQAELLAHLAPKARPEHVGIDSWRELCSFEALPSPMAAANRWHV